MSIYFIYNYDKWIVDFNFINKWFLLMIMVIMLSLEKEVLFSFEK